MEGYLCLYIFPLAAVPWRWRINHHSCLFPEWCSALLCDKTASLNLNVHSSSAAGQDKANQHQMPPRWTYCLALESLTLTHLLINITRANPSAGFSETAFHMHFLTEALTGTVRRNGTSWRLKSKKHSPFPHPGTQPITRGHNLTVPPQSPL